MLNMTKFNIGDCVTINGYDGVFKITGVDCLSSPLVKYSLDRSYGNGNWVYESNLKKYVSEEEVLHYGKILVDEEFAGINKDMFIIKTDYDDLKYIRIRVIFYEDNIYYHKMENGEVIEFGEINP